jgi:hypothetical protein
MNELMNINKTEKTTAIFATTEETEANANIRFASEGVDNKQLFNALRGKSESVKDLIGERIEIASIVITGANVNKDINDETKGKENRPITHFFTTDNRHISSMSHGIAVNAQALFECGMYPTSENPIKIEFTEVQTKRGTAYSFDLV